MRKIIFTIWMDASDKHPDGAVLTVKVTPASENSYCRPELSFTVNGDASIAIEAIGYEIISEKTNSGWDKLLSLEFDGIILSIKSKLRKQQYFHVDLPEVIREGGIFSPKIAYH